MNWWGKLIGGAFGYMLGGPLGALLGAAVGHNFDRGMQDIQTGSVPAGDRQSRTQAAFFATTFSVMGHVCKADGLVTPDEISTARTVMDQMDLSPAQKKSAIALFNEGKKKDFPLDDVLQQFRMEAGGSSNIKRLFIEIQCHAACADGIIHQAEKSLLMRICGIIGFPQYDFECIMAAVRAQVHHQQRTGKNKSGRMSLKDAYKILNIPASATEAEVKRAYRRLLSQHHPDKLVSKGLPEEMMKVATQRTHEIRQAYERIREEKRD